MFANLAVRPTVDAVLPADFLERREAHPEGLGHLLFGRSKVLRQLLEVDVRARRHGLLRMAGLRLGRLASAPAAAGARGARGEARIEGGATTRWARWSPGGPKSRMRRREPRRIHACYLRSHTDAPLFRGAAHRFKRGGWGRVSKRRKQKNLLRRNRGVRRVTPVAGTTTTPLVPFRPYVFGYKTYVFGKLSFFGSELNSVSSVFIIRGYGFWGSRFSSFGLVLKLDPHFWSKMEKSRHESRDESVNIITTCYMCQVPKKSAFAPSRAESRREHFRIPYDS
jgi:hypothetical protein